MDVKSLIPGMLSRSKDHLWTVAIYTNANGACQSGTVRNRLRQEMNRTRERGSLGRLFRENIKTFLNGILHHVGMIPDSVDQMLAGM